MEKLEKIAAGRPAVFVSPHLDDAVFSAGALIYTLARSHTPLSVITVFTDSAPPPETLSAKRFVRSCGFTDAPLLFKERQREDKCILQKIGAVCTHLGFTDAAWRKKAGRQNNLLSRFFPELIHRYPLRISKYLGQIHPEDGELMRQIERKLLTLVAPGSTVFCPAATGNHVDHRIVRAVCEKLFPRTILWDDFPYSLKSRAQLKGYGEVAWEKNPGKKRELILAYRTQKHLVENIAPVAERFFISPHFPANER